MQIVTRTICIVAVLTTGIAIHAPAQDASVTAQPAANPVKAVLGNDGTPMLVPFQCSAEDIRWGGLSCSDEAPCSIFLEVATVEALGNRILLAGNIHSDAVTLYSVLLSSDDNGHTWEEPFERIRSAGLDHIEHLGSDLAWIGGQVLFPITQEPFLLKTTDGGRSWQLHEVLSDESDNRFGSIQQFFFTARDTGALIIDRGAGGGNGERYALYETPNGGDTWSVKQESRAPIVIKRPPAPVSDWRVRADAAMKSYIVEHRVGQRWSAVAAFLVKLDPCKPSESPNP